MKIYFLSICLVLTSLITANGQDLKDLSKGLGIEVELGGNFVNLSQDFNDPGDEDFLKYRLAPRLGITATKNLNENITASLGVFYSSKGAAFDLGKEINDPAVEVMGYQRLIVNYLEIPVQIGYKLTDELSLNVGPYLALGLSAETKWDFTITEQGSSDTEVGSEPLTFSNEEISGNGTDEIRGSDIGAIVGVRYQLNQLGFGLNYLAGFSNLTPEDPQDPSFNPSTEKRTNSGVNFSISYILK